MGANIVVLTPDPPGTRIVVTALDSVKAFDSPGTRIVVTALDSVVKAFDSPGTRIVVTALDSVVKAFDSPGTRIVVIALDSVVKAFDSPGTRIDVVAFDSLGTLIVVMVFDFPGTRMVVMALDSVMVFDSPGTSIVIMALDSVMVFDSPGARVVAVTFDSPETEVSFERFGSVPGVKEVFDPKELVTGWLNTVLTPDGNIKEETPGRPLVTRPVGREVASDSPGTRIVVVKLGSPGTEVTLENIGSLPGINGTFDPERLVTRRLEPRLVPGGNIKEEVPECLLLTRLDGREVALDSPDKEVTSEKLGGFPGIEGIFDPVELVTTWLETVLIPDDNLKEETPGCTLVKSLDGREVPELFLDVVPLTVWKDGDVTDGGTVSVEPENVIPEPLGPVDVVPLTFGKNDVTLD